MDVQSPQSGICVTQAAPAVSLPARTPFALTIPAVANVELPSSWPRPAQRVTAALLVIAISLLAWHVSLTSRWAARPTTLESDPAVFRIDLNRADYAQLLQLPAVGESLARRIDDYRREHGGFRDLDDLRRVGGIGPATLERLRPFVYVQAVDFTDGEDQLADQEQPKPLLRPQKKPAVKKPTTSKKAEALAGPIDLNRATEEELQRLPGVGLKMSARIVAAREEKPFREIGDLRRVHGIGAKTLERLRPFVVVKEE